MSFGRARDLAGSSCAHLMALFMPFNRYLNE
jgi:hypothetical protein